MTDQRDIATQIRRFVLQESNVDDPEFVQGHTDLLASGILDSLFIVSLVSFCEEQFDIEFDLDELSEDSFRSVAALTTLVKAKLAGC